MPKTKFEINKEIVFSTAHISEECNDALSGFADEDDPIARIINYEYEYGYRLYINPNELTPTTEFPELNRLMARAKLSRCKWLLLDQNGPEYEGFETFDW